jgi:hypothetical protein
VIAPVISWYFRQRHDELWSLISQADEQQVLLLEQLSDKLSLTQYGQKLGIRESMTYRQFAQRVPVVEYEDLQPYIERNMKGEQLLLWPGDITWFAKSSGTTSNTAKYIPISYESLEYSHYMGGREALTQYLSFCPESRLFEGKGLLVGGSHQVNQLSDRSYYGDLSAVLMNHLPTWANWKSTPDLDIALMENWEEKLEAMAQAVSKDNVTSMSGVPTWTLVLMQRILEITGAAHMHEVWPNMELFIHGGVSFTPYREQFKALFPDPHMHYVETYNASEGFFGVQAYADKPEMLLMTHHGVFYEFYEPEKGPSSAVPLWEVKTQIRYAVVITTNSGLWRYSLGDTVVFHQLKPYTFTITGRVKLFINAFGEELVIENADSAMAETALQCGVRVQDYTAAPRYMDQGNPGHEWVIEFDGQEPEKQEFALVLDRELQARNGDYQAKRQGDLAMKLPTLHFAPRGTFRSWLKSKGKLGGQHKVPRLANNRDILNEVLALLGH